MLKVSKIITLLLVLTTLSAGLMRDPSATTWSTETGLITTSGRDESPHLTRLQNNSLVMVWDSDRAFTGDYDVYLIRNNGAAWSLPEAVGGQKLQGLDLAPTITQLVNGSLLVAWSRQNGTGYDLVYSIFNGTLWGPTVPVVSEGSKNLGVDATVTPDGRVWLFWGSNRNDPSDIFYKYSWNSGGNWSQDIQMPFSKPGFVDRSPSIAVGPDGNILLAWESWVNSTNSEIFLTKFDGVHWSGPLQLTTDPNLDGDPSLAATDDGSLWVIWVSPRFSTSNPQTNDLLLKRCYVKCTLSLANWSADQRLTTDENQDIQPSAAQVAPGKVGVVWSTNRMGDQAGGWNIFYATLTEDSHNLQLLNVRPDYRSVPPGHTVSIQVNSTNQGTAQQDVLVKLYAEWTAPVSNSTLLISNSTLLTSYLATLAIGQKWTVNYSWDTTGWIPGFYRVRAEISSNTNSCLEPSAENCQSMSGGAVIVAARALSIKSAPKIIPSYPNNPVYRGQTISLRADVMNTGQIPESFIMTFQSNSTFIGNVTVTSLPPGSTTTVFVSWNTTSVKPGACLLSAQVPGLPFENNLADNQAQLLYNYSQCVRKTGDTDGNGRVDLSDLIAVWSHEFTRNPQYDINADHIVNLSDLILTYLNMFT